MMNMNLRGYCIPEAVRTYWRTDSGVGWNFGKSGATALGVFIPPPVMSEEEIGGTTVVLLPSAGVG